jgi:glycosyltransferase involved in cell wall biosynthesis
MHPPEIEMPDHPLVSIIITSYNYGRYLRQCIDNALAQTYANREVIVIDDGSSDDSPQIIRTYGDRIRAVLKPNEGPASSWNLGFTLSRGQFVLFLDSDDALLPTAIDRALPLFDSPGVVRVQWPLHQIDADGRRTGGFIPGTELHEGDLRDALLRNGPASYVSAPTSGNLWRRSFLDQVLPVPPQFKLMCDAYLMTMSPLHGAIRFLPEPQALYRTHGKNDYHGMSFLPRLERDIQSFEHRCQLLRDYCAEHGLTPNEQGWKSDSWFYRLQNVTRQLQSLVPEGEKFLIVENGSWGMDRSIGRTPIPFLEKDGAYYGAPPDDPTAIRELERMRAQGATLVAFGWPAFWWMEHYPAFAAYLRTNFKQVANNEDLIAFKL